MRELSRRLLSVLLALLVVALVSPPSPAAQSDTTVNPALFGTWRLDLKKSKYSPGPPPRGETRIYARDAQGIKGTIERHYADGRKETIDYRADAGHDSPVSGTQAYDTARFKTIDPHTTEAVLSHAGRVYGYARREISADGQTLTITFRRIEPGDMVNNVAVYAKAK